MKTQHTFTVLAIIGSILVGGVSIGDAYAADYDELLEKMVNVNSRLADLKESQNDVNELTLAKTAFEIEQVKKSMLEINDMNVGQYDRLDKIYDYLKADYYTTIKSYNDGIKQYEKENGLTFTERQLLSKINSQKIAFDMNESKQDYDKKHQELLIKEIEKVKAKEEYQKLVNEIGKDLANQANGNDVQKIHHKLAIKKIVDSKNWDVAVPAIDRIIKQVSSEESKQKLETIKNKVDQLLDKKRKVSKNQEVFQLNDGKPEFAGPNFVGFGGVLENQYISEQLFNTEIETLLETTDEAIPEIQTNSVENTSDENDIIITFDGILESEIEESLEEVDDITQEDAQEVDDEREQQRKHARENDRSKPDSKGKPDFATGKPDNLGKPDAAGKPSNPGKPDNTGKSDTSSKSDNSEKSKHKGKPENPGKND